MVNVLIAGLPAGLASLLAQRLQDAAVQMAYDGDDAVEQLRAGDWSLLILDHALPGLPASEVLRWTRTESSLGGLRTIYCLDPGEDGSGESEMEALASRLEPDRILLHPLDRGELARQAAVLLDQPEREMDAFSSAAREDPIASAVAKVWERSREVTLDRISTVEKAVVAALGGMLLGPQRHEAESAAHKLTGSLGTFGFAKGSQIAREIEHALASGTRLGPQHGARLAEMVAALRREVDRPPAPPSAPAPAPVRAAAPGDRPYVLVVDDDEPLGEALVRAGATRGMEVAVAPSPQAARQALAARRPDVVLLDLSFPDEGEDGRTFLTQLAQRHPGVPVLVATARNSLVDRVRVLQLGGRGFLQKPFTAAQALDAVERHVPRLRAAPETRILAVDDDPQILAAVRAILEPHGIRVHTLENPLRFWTALEEASPDLVMLDVDMPYLTGIELCRVLRSDVKRGALPVLFLTANTNPDTVYRVFAAGADDFVPKPVVGPELLARIRNRLDRMRATAGAAQG